MRALRLSACRVAGKGRPFPAPSEPCVRLSPHTAQAGSSHSPASGFWLPPLVTVTGLRWHLPFPSGSKPLLRPVGAHQTHVSTLSGRASPYPAGYAFPSPFGRWPSLLGSSWPAGDWPPLRSVNCLARQPPTGLPRSARSRNDRRGCPLYRREDRCPRKRGCASLPLAIRDQLSLSSDRRLNRFRRPQPGLIEGSLAFTRPVFPWPGFPARLGSP